MHTAFLSFGTNIGDRLANLKDAIASLPPAVHLVDCSPVYETLPWGYTDQGKFLNQVLKVETDLDPQDLLVYLKSLENKLGRKKTFRYGPRLIDLDILFYDDLVMENPGLTIP
ncbi:MAG: 2-amino-4-hydroxy-6-hydroxymethyldihydropteridine diphosphokinase, partial [Omnitrophica WOR_2 bacterium]